MTFVQLWELPVVKIPAQSDIAHLSYFPEIPAVNQKT